MSKIIKKKKLRNLEIDIQEDGFTIWMTEKNIDGTNSRNWLVDGSLVKENGIIRLSGDMKNDLKAKTKYDKENNEIRLVKRGKKIFNLPRDCSFEALNNCASKIKESVVNKIK